MYRFLVLAVYATSDFEYITPLALIVENARNAEDAQNQAMPVFIASMSESEQLSLTEDDFESVNATLLSNIQIINNKG